MSEESFFQTDEERIDGEAAHWLAREDAGFSPQEQAQFDDWLAADFRHREAIAAFHEMRAGFGLLANEIPDDGKKPDPELLAPRQEKRLKTGQIVSLAAAGLAACLVLVFFMLTNASHPDASSHRTYNNRLAAQELTRHFLPDGTLLELRASSIVEINYDQRRRSLNLLEGEVHFSVAKDKSRPFVVSVGDAAFKAVGTAFTVRLSDEEVELLVTEGLVSVDRIPKEKPTAQLAETPQRPTLEENQRLHLSRLRQAQPLVVETVSSAELQEQLNWKRETLYFENTPLSEAIEAFNQRNRDQLVIEDAQLRSKRIDGTFQSDDLEAFAEVMQISTGASVIRTAKGTIILGR